MFYDVVHSSPEAFDLFLFWYAHAAAFGHTHAG